MSQREGNRVLRLWQRLSVVPGGAWLFGQLICFRAPYFSTIQPRFIDLRSGRAEVGLKKRRAVQNHIGTIHAIAICNLAELAGGTMTEVTIPLTHRWIPKGMTVEYLQKATTNLRAVATLDAVTQFATAAAVPVTVQVLDAAGQLVVRAVISMWISPRQ